MTKEKLYEILKNLKDKFYEPLKEAKDYTIFLLLLILFSLPLLRLIKPLAPYFLDGDYCCILYIGIIGVYVFAANLIIKFWTSPNKKECFKTYLPIFLLLLYLIWTCISCCFAENRKYAFLGNSYRREGLTTYLAYAGIFGLGFSISSKKVKKILLYCFTIFSLTMILLIQISNIFNINNLVSCKNIKDASFYQFNHYGYYLLMSASISGFLFITEKKKFPKIINLIFYGIFTYFLIFNDTFGCYLSLWGALITFLIITFIKKEKNKLIFVLIGILIVLSFTVNTGSNQNIAQRNFQSLAKDAHKLSDSDSTNADWKQVGTGRGELWIYGLKFFSKRPILGYGPENLGELYANEKIDQDRPHNILIQLLTTSGLPGLILYCSAIAIILLRGLKKLDMNNPLYSTCFFTVLAYLMSAMFGNSMFYTSPYYFVLLGFLFYEIVKSEAEK